MLPRCIWCLREAENTTNKHIEHIIPESLGCPLEFVLPSSIVCRRCNNELAKLDQSVVGELEVFRFMHQISGKGGKPPTIATRGNVRGQIVDGKPTILFNKSREMQQMGDYTVSGMGKSPRNIIPTFDELPGGLGRVRFSHPLFEDWKAIRGLYKIAFESLVFFLGAELGVEGRFDSVREFVMRGTSPKRRVILRDPGDSRYLHEATPPWVDANGQYVVRLRLAVVEFIADLSSDVSLFPKLLAEAQNQWGDRGWSPSPANLK